MASRTTNHPVSNCAVQHLNSAVGVSFGRNPRGADRDCAMVMANIRRQHGLEPEPERAPSLYCAMCLQVAPAFPMLPLFGPTPTHTHTLVEHVDFDAGVRARV